MRVRNKTAHFQRCGGKTVRPWREAVVPDHAEVNEEFLEIVTKSVEVPSKSIQPKKKKEGSTD